MTVESAVYINALSLDLPRGDDFLSEGDDHIRLIKQVLRQTFPNITGPVTLTESALNLAGFPAGTRMLFQQSYAPPGWFRVNFSAYEAMLRIVSTDSVDGVVRGVHSPIINNIVVQHAHNVDRALFSHSHDVSGTTAAESRGHTHYVSLGGGSHSHTYERGDGAFAVGTSSAQTRNVGPRTGTITGGSHSHSGSSGGASQTHGHYFLTTSFGARWTGSNPNTATSGEEGWKPKYFNTILCQRSSS